ncbi:hypothetical protein NDU88_006755 [Pleurodeles waltl]|uniref:Uncharacterized protein n=1 Tax=Pleurodeles waltl TaxID=8319 RepID=A0AAV7NVC2_PLEWA|nr:hypothetical protein NDU88_006755 [Pleurodeles waltl]
MAMAGTKKDWTLGEMLSKPTGGLASDHPPPASQEMQMEDEGTESPVTHSLIASLFASLRDDLQMAKKDLSQALKAVRRELTELGDRVSTLEDHETSQDEEI